jgi:hypothetical protein
MMSIDWARGKARFALGEPRARYCAFNPVSSHLGVLNRGWSRDVARIKGARA